MGVGLREGLFKGRACLRGGLVREMLITNFGIVLKGRPKDTT